MSLGINTRITNTREQPSTFSRGKTLYVGGTGDGNYTRIQDAIDDAVDGDTVFVYDDSSPYCGGVVINKMINLIGENRDTTVIELGSQFIVKITADNVNISGFTMQWAEGVGIYIYSNYNTITGNNILYNSWGIGIMNSSSNTITGNNIFNNGIMDIYLWFSSNNTITNNNIMNDYWNGICLRFSSNNTITGNNITSKEAHGIHLSDSSNNTITGNNISNNGYGIGLAGFSNNNIITGNTITWNNRSGIKLVGFSNYNIIYHNNFINNTNNANDECENIWDNGYPIGGNYWSDYTGEDNDGDGIGDTPYNIDGGDNKDYYPFMEPLDILYPIANFTYFVDESPVLFDASSSYDPDGTIISYEWDFGDGKTGYGKITSNKYCDIGTYDVTLTVTDDTGLKDSITKNIEVILPNIPPSIPKINGPKSGRPGIKYEYNFLVTDPDGDVFYLWVDWGDGDNTNWIGPYSSDVQVKLSHSWNEAGKYVIKAKLQDICHEEAWGSFKVTMPRNRATQRPFLNFLQSHPYLFPILQKILLYLME